MAHNEIHKTFHFKKLPTTWSENDKRFEKYFKVGTNDLIAGYLETNQKNYKKQNNLFQAEKITSIMILQDNFTLLQCSFANNK